MKFCLLFTLVSSLLIGCYYDKEVLVYPTSTTTCDTTAVKFSTTLLPLLNASCNSCHGGAASAGAGIVLDNYTGVKTSVNSGKFLNSILQNGAASAMPKGGSKLADCDITKIKVWINAGALNN